MRNRSRIAAEPDPTKTGLGIAAPPMSSDTGAIRKKNRAAAALGRAGGKKGGRARAARLSPEERRASAQKAATMRWAKPPSELSAGDEPPRIVEGEILPPNGDLPPPSPFAKFRGQIDLSGNIVDVYVLDTGERVLSMRGAVKAMTGQDAGNLVEYISIQGLKDFINKDLVLVGTKDFFIPGTQFRGRGITAEQFEAILTGYVQALNAKTLTTDRQREIAITCAILSTAFLRVGIIAQIDEATGYQYVRAEDALQIKLRAFIADELRAWEKTFPDELWEQFGRLTHWKGGLHSRPKWWGHLVMELIYDALDPDIAKYLKENKPKPYHGQNYHQWFTQDIGLKALIPHIFEIIGIAKTCRDLRELREKVAEHYGREPVQLTMYLPRAGLIKN
jgi:P63C domain